MKKIVNVKKFVVSTTILFLLILLGGSALVNVTYSCNKIDYKTVYVTQGDTLWKIASEEQLKNSYYKDKDVRDIIYDIKEINNLNISDLKIGQELKILIN